MARRETSCFCCAAAGAVFSARHRQRILGEVRGHHAAVRLHGPGMERAGRLCRAVLVRSRAVLRNGCIRRRADADFAGHEPVAGARIRCPRRCCRRRIRRLPFVPLRAARLVFRARHARLRRGLPHPCQRGRVHRRWGRGLHPAFAGLAGVPARLCRLLLPAGGTGARLVDACLEAGEFTPRRPADGDPRERGGGRSTRLSTPSRSS